MKLYYAKGTCSLAVRIIINELNIPCEYEAVNLGTKKTASGDDFYKINPKGYVPTLVLDNSNILTENSAIQLYLADTYQAKNLLPDINDFKRYRVIEWLNFVSTELHKACGPLFNGKIPAELKVTIFIPNLKTKLDFVENHLQESEFLVGDNFTLPDAYLFVILTWLPKLGIDMAQWKQISAYYAKLKEYDAIKKSLVEES